MKKSLVHVTDHALLRHLERVLGVDVEALRHDVGRSIDKVMVEGACGVVIGGFDYRIEGMTVVTVVPSSRPDRRTGRVRRVRDE